MAESVCGCSVALDYFVFGTRAFREKGMKEEFKDLERFERDDFSLKDLWHVLISQKKWLIGLPFICVFLAVVGVFLSKPKWEATAVIQIGQVGQSGVGQGSQLIEPPVRAIERMKMKSFEDDVLTRLKISSEEGNPMASLFRSTLALKALGTTDLIQVKIRAHSREQAQSWANAVVDRLKDVHERLAQPTIDRLRKQQAELKKQMLIIEEERSSLLRIVSKSSETSGDSRFSANLLLSNLLLQKNAELRDFEMRRLAADEQLTSVRTYPTSLIDRIYVPEKPASPKKLLVVILAAVLGFILGVIVALLRNYWQSAKVPA
jgi:capsular polysaccharide biosynthesis protein